MAGKKKMRIFKHYTHSGHELTDRQFWFIHYFIQTHSRTKAAEKAGISVNDVGHILNKDYVIEELEYLEGKISDKAQIDTARLYQELWQIGTGFQKDPFGFDIAPSDRIKALTELLKRTDDIKQKEKLLKDSCINIKITRDYKAIPEDIATNNESEGDSQ